jgi:hypothetical protein
LKSSLEAGGKIKDLDSVEARNNRSGGVPVKGGRPLLGFPPFIATRRASAQKVFDALWSPALSAYSTNLVYAWTILLLFGDHGLLRIVP